jgi:hypothetical protein
MYVENVWHDSFVMPLETIENSEHVVEWITALDDPIGDEIHDLREGDYTIMGYEA